jgi:hypothetical protein
MALTKASYSMITGAVANILDYGAVANYNENDPSSGTDSSAAIQAAVNAVAATSAYNKGAVFIPAGSYKILTQINVPYGVSIFGEGGAASVLHAQDCDGLVFTSFGYALGSMFYQDFGLTAATGFNRIAIYVPPDASTGDGLHFNRVRLYDWNVGFTLNSTWSTNVNECMISPVRTGIALGAATGAQTVKIQLRDNQITYGASAKGNADKVGVQIGGTNEFNEATHLSGNSIFGFDICVKIIEATYVTIIDNDLNSIVDAITFTTARGGFYIAYNFIETYGTCVTAFGASTDDLSRLCVIEGNTLVGLTGTPGTAQFGVRISTSDATTHGGSIIVQNNVFGGFAAADIVGRQIENTKILNNICNSSTPTNNISITTARSVAGSVNVVANNYCLKAIYIDPTAYTAGNVILQNNAENGVFRAWQQSAAPTTGTWLVGDQVFNNAPATGQPMGWMCTVAGTPGTWRPMANLA